jgi:tetratricopeptide (TPR) repeat protein
VLQVLALSIAVLFCTNKEKADSLLFEGQYEELLILVNSALEDSPSEEERIDLLEYKAYAQVALGDTTEARKTFQQLLFIDPFHHLDPMQVSPKIRSVFDRAKDLLSQRSESSRLFTLEQEFFSLKDRIQRSKDALKWSLIFPGLGQMKRKSSIGLPLFIAASADILFLGYSHWQVGRAHRDYLDRTTQFEIDRAYDTYRTWYRARGYALGALGGLWLASVIEAALSL